MSADVIALIVLAALPLVYGALGVLSGEPDPNRHINNKRAGGEGGQG